MAEAMAEAEAEADSAYGYEINDKSYKMTAQRLLHDSQTTAIELLNDCLMTA
jgi:hypothetical protein